MRAAEMSQRTRYRGGIGELGPGRLGWPTCSPTVDADRFEMRIAPRTLACANGWRISEPIGGKRFDELEDPVRGRRRQGIDRVATMGLMGETLMQSRLRDVSRLADELMALIRVDR